MVVAIKSKEAYERTRVYTNVVKYDYNETRHEITLMTNNPAEMYIIHYVKEVRILSF